MFSYIVGFSVACALLWILRPLAVRIGLVDQPGDRKLHQGNVALVGGIAMFCGFTFSVLILDVSLSGFRVFFTASALLVIVGILDDLHELPSWSRFVAQVFAALIMTLWGGVIVEDLGAITGGQSVILSGWAIPFTVFATIGVINALNMSDGVDGLAGGLSFIAFALLSYIAFSGGRIADGAILALLVCVVGAFLLFNFRFPWRKQGLVFMGDAGSMFLGFALVWFVISLSQGQERVMTPVTALWILALPLIDAVGVLVRRILRGQSPIEAARDHLHHKLLDMGYSVNGTLSVMLISAIILAVLGMLAFYRGIAEHLLFYGFLALFSLHLWVMMQIKDVAVDNELRTED